MKKMNSDWIQDSTIVMVKYGCMLGHHCLRPCFDCHWEFSSQDRPQRLTYTVIMTYVLNLTLVVTF